MTGVWFSEEVLGKARRYLADGRVTPDPHPGTYWVQGSGPKRYRVQTDADEGDRRITFAVCSCPHGKNTSGLAAHCSHVAAVLLLIRDGTKTPSP